MCSLCVFTDELQYRCAHADDASSLQFCSDLDSLFVSQPIATRTSRGQLSAAEVQPARQARAEPPERATGRTYPLLTHFPPVSSQATVQAPLAVSLLRKRARLQAGVALLVAVHLWARAAAPSPALSFPRRASGD